MNPLTRDDPRDTLNACADVLAFLANQTTQDDDESEAIRNGRWEVLRCVEDAVRTAL